MNKTIEEFEKIERLLFNLLLGSFIVNMLVVSVIILSDGDVPLWLMAPVVTVAIFYVVVFFMYLYRVFSYYKASPRLNTPIWKSIVGVVITPLGLLFTFFNYMIIVLANIY